MEFIHNTGLEDTIVAIATPPGEGAISAIRLSGKNALLIADKAFSGSVHKYKTHTAHYGKIIDSKGKTIDQVLLLVMIAPRSYTGENTVEFFCHGGKIITQKVYERLLELGTRAALPGEFTFRAFRNGKLDLAQAEAVQSFIGAQNEQALKIAEQQLEGRLSVEIQNLQKPLLHILGMLEAWVDFPEEDLEFAHIDDVLNQLRNLKSQMQELVETYDYGHLVDEGFSLCLMGPPNAGKSSLMNALLGKDRAIVTDIAGTTRDILEEKVFFGNLHFKIVDTAGIRKTKEIIEQEGIKRSLKAKSQADLTLLVLDPQEQISLDTFGELDWNKTLVVWNKMDLQKAPPKMDLPFQVEISALKKQNLDQLHLTIEKMLFDNKKITTEKPVLTRSRHKASLKNAVQSIERVIEGLKNQISPEFLCADLRMCLNDLGTIIGMNVTEDILDEIFSTFCLGK